MPAYPTSCRRRSRWWQTESHRPTAVGFPFEHLAAFVEVVVVAAQQGEVVQIGRPIVTQPLVEVVGLTPAREPVAAGPHAPAVTHDQRPPLGDRDAVTPAAHVKWLGGTTQHHRDDRGVAGQATSRGGRQVAAVGELASGQAPVGDAGPKPDSTSSKANSRR